jgi:hypothetical protein
VLREGEAVRVVGVRGTVLMVEALATPEVAPAPESGGGERPGAI